MSEKNKFLVCIDSDGCAFDTMEVKHKECFCPAYINYFGLQAVSKYARDAWDFANLYSSYRGIHRLLSLLKALDVLSERKEVKERKFTVPAMSELRAYVNAKRPLSNAGLEEYLREHPESDEIRRTLEWSINVNERVKELVHGVPPFPQVRESLEKLSKYADIVIVSATQQSALEREWGEHGLLDLIYAVKGQESGTKKEIIASLKGDYEDGHVLMIGDAPGDRDAAHANGALFYPICPDEEAESWARFDESMDAFLNGSHAGELELKNIAYFETLLPTEPKWKRG
jgi:phosphoglycolate phosphatase-like HAD superfamily hydrolase